MRPTSVVRRRFAAMATAVLGFGILVVAGEPAAAVPPAPVVLNGGAQNSGNAQWMETQALPADAEPRTFRASFLVEHAPGRRINQMFISGPGVNGTFTVTGQTYAGAAGALVTSRVSAAVRLGTPGGFSCPFIGGATRSVDAPVSVRVIDSTGEQSATLSTTVKFVADENCQARQDFPRLTAASQSHTEVIPGQEIHYTFSCDDVDPDAGFTEDDTCERANVRWRRLNDGDTSAPTLVTGLADNTPVTISRAFPTRGHYVVEAQFGNEDGNFPNLGGQSGGWWRLGNAVVNDAADTLTGSIGFSGAAPSTPPSVNPGTAVDALATVDDGVADPYSEIQVIEWDADNDGGFERFEHGAVFNSGGNLIHVPPTAAERTQTVDTTTPGLFTVRARLTDNGAMDAADDIRRQLIVTGQLRVNAVPTAGDVATATDEDTPVTITLAGSDPDAQPDPLAYDIVTAPPASAGTLSEVSGGSVTFTPAADFTGTTSFTYQARDGGPQTVGAHATSNLATVTIEVVPVNDSPVAAADSYDAPTNDVLVVPAPGVLGNDTDPEGDPLSAVLATGPAHGTVNLAADGSFSYRPEAGFQGVDSFSYAASDGNSSSPPVTVSLIVAPMLTVSDAPPVAERPGRGVNYAEFVVSLTGPATSVVRVHVATADGTATAGADYQALSLDLRFEPGQTRKFVRVRVLADRLAEPQEQFNLVLSQPDGAKLLDSTGTGTILPS